MRRPRVYLSGPLTKGDRSHNVYQFMRAHEILMRKGYAVFNPGMTALLPWAWEVSHADWLESDLPWVECSELVIRLPGESDGADQETARAKKHKIPVMHVYSVTVLERLENANIYQASRPTNGRSDSAAESFPAVTPG